MTEGGGGILFIYASGVGSVAPCALCPRVACLLAFFRSEEGRGKKMEALMFLQPAGKKARALETVEQQGCEGALLGGGGREAPNGADVVEGVRVWGIPPDAFSPPPPSCVV